MSVHGRFTKLITDNLAIAIGTPVSEYIAYFRVGGYAFKALAVSSITTRKDFVDSSFESIQITVVMEPKYYHTAIIPNYENIELTLVKQNTGTVKTREKKVYKAVLPKVIDYKLIAEITAHNEPGVVNDTDLTIATFNLFDIATYDLRQHSVGGIYTGTTTKKLIMYLLSSNNLEDKYSSSKAVEYINVDLGIGDTPYGKIKIPEDKTITTGIKYIQEAYGVSTMGLGCFLSNRSWYVFQPYAVKKYQTAINRLTIINVPASTHRALERTFHIDGKTVTVLATGETKHGNTSEQDYLNGGTGVIFSDPRKLINWTDVDKTRTPTTKTEATTTAYRTASHSSGYNRVEVLPSRFSDNPMAVASTMASRGAQLVEVMWENGELDLIVPGMAVKFLFERDGDIKTLYGTVHRAVKHSSIRANGIIETDHKTIIKLSLWLKELKK